MRRLSKVEDLPVLRRFLPGASPNPPEADREGYGRCQRTARRAVAEVAPLVKEGWTERQAAELLGQCLGDYGVRAFFHHPFAWFGERTRFDGIRSYGQFSPSDRVILPGEVFILDVAPILDGYVSDIGFAASLGPNEDLAEARRFLARLRDEIPALAVEAASGGALWREVDSRIREAGYDNVHQRYPFAVLGHRLPNVSLVGPPLKVFNFGWQSFFGLATRGLFGQLLGPHYEGDLRGLWAVEPHIGGRGFGAKFEEILVVTDGGAHWLQEAFL